MRAYQRLLRYVNINTQSSERGHVTPSSDSQFRLARVLAKEMTRLGLERVYTDEHAYTYGFLPATQGREQEPVVGLIAHIDTSPDFSAEGVRPFLYLHYDGRDLPLGESGRVLRTRDFPDLLDCIGHTLISSDGTTLLGADDKAGVAEILTACERLIREQLPHCGVAVCLTPDEEIGHGASLLDLERLGADFAYTVDGDAVNEINYETFNAAAASFRIHGVSVHPGSAKRVRRNAGKIAAEILAALPKDECPERTDGRDGFYHPDEIAGTVGEARLRVLVRDFSPEGFARRKEELGFIARDLDAKYGAGTVSLEIRDQYRNMEEVMRRHPALVRAAADAIAAAGYAPSLSSVRGGTDGATLSWRGIPCPNIGFGGRNCHGEREFLVVEEFEAALRVVLDLACGTAARAP